MERQKQPQNKPMTYLVPVLRLFPIWRWGRLYVGEGWYPDPYETREFATREAAEAFVEDNRWPLR